MATSHNKKIPHINFAKKNRLDFVAMRSDLRLLGRPVDAGNAVRQEVREILEETVILRISLNMK